MQQYCDLHSTDFTEAVIKTPTPHEVHKAPSYFVTLVCFWLRAYFTSTRSLTSLYDGKALASRLTGMRNVELKTFAESPSESGFPGVL